MSKDEPRRRFRDRISLRIRGKNTRSDLSVPGPSHTSTEASTPPPAGRVPSSDPKTTVASSLNVSTASKQAPRREDFGEAKQEELAQQITPRPAASEQSLWALAYNELHKSKPELVKDFHCYLGLTTTKSEDGLFSPRIDGVAQEALKRLQEPEKEKRDGMSATIRKYFDQAVKIVIASKDHISSAVSANPYAAIAWIGVSLLLPLLLSPTEENEAAIKGLDYIANLLIVYRWQEKTYLQDGDAGPDFKKQAVLLYTAILEYEATLLVHKQQKGPKRWVSNVLQAGDWSSRVTSIQLCDANCRDVTNAISSLRTKKWRDEERKWQDELLQQLPQGEEKRHIRMLYSNYEAGKNVNPERIPGTCEWFLNHTGFTTWRESQSSDLLWLSADPGCGKSVLSKHLVDRRGDVLTVNAEPPTVCYFFFKDGDVDRMDGAKAICAFLHQLIIQQPPLYRHAKVDFENKNEKFLTDFDALWNIFLKAVEDSLSREVVCVLDALDECQEHSRRTLIAELVRLYEVRRPSSNTKPILKFLVTSRPDFGIVRDFKDLTSIFSEVRLRGEEESERVSREIDLVIRYKVEELGSKMGLSKSNKSALRENLLIIPHRTYLWLYLTFDAIAKKLELSKGEIAVIAKTIPKNVDEAYTAILDKSPDRERAKRALHIVLAAARPLTLQEINIAMVIDECHQYYEDLDMWQVDVSEDRIKNMCGLFLSVVDSKVYLIHQTAREFLVCEDYIESSSALPIWKNRFSPTQSHYLLAQICIWYLQLRDSEAAASEAAASEAAASEAAASEAAASDYGGSDYGGSEHKDSENIELEQFYEDRPLLSYAAQHWAEHFTQSDDLPDSALIERVAYRVYDTLSQSFKIWFDEYCKVHKYYMLSWPPPQNGKNVHVISYFGHDIVMKLLLERDSAQADTRDSGGRTPLSFAAERGHETVARLLLKYDAQADSKDIDDLTPLSCAAAHGHEAVVRLLLEREDVLADSKDLNNRTPLSCAAANGHEAVVRLLLEREDVLADSKDTYSQTPLSWAAAYGHEAVARLLLEREDVLADSKDAYDQTPLSCAAEYGHEAVVRLLLEREDVLADSKDKTGRTPLLWAAARGHEAVVRLLLEREDVLTDSKDNEGHTPLYYAERWNHKAVVKLLKGSSRGHQAMVEPLEERLDEADHTHPLP